MSKERTYKVAVHKCLILEEIFLAQANAAKRPLKKEKREHAPAVDNVVIYSIKYSRDYGESQEEFQD